MFRAKKPCPGCQYTSSVPEEGATSSLPQRPNYGETAPVLKFCARSLASCQGRPGEFSHGEYSEVLADQFSSVLQGD